MVTPEFLEKLKKDILNDRDMYNPKTGIYAFHYNDKDAIACYHLTPEEANSLAKEATTLEKYWSELLGPGGSIFDDPDEFINSYGCDDGWVPCYYFRKNCLTFDSDDEAKEWGKKQNLSKYAYINCKINGENVILCQTNLVYEDEVWNKVYDAMKFLMSLLPNDVSDDAGIDEASELRDMALELFQKNNNVRILEVYDEY